VSEAPESGAELRKVNAADNYSQFRAIPVKADLGKLPLRLPEKAGDVYFSSFCAIFGRLNLKVTGAKGAGVAPALYFKRNFSSTGLWSE